MALQIKRCTEATRLESTVILESGQPLYTTDEHKLFIGDGVTEAKDLQGTVVGLNVENGSVEPTDSEPYKGGSIISAWKYDDDAVYTLTELPVASGHESIAWGKKCVASGKRSVAIGNNNKSGGNCSFALGQSNTVAPATNSTASGTVVAGYSNIATRNYSFTCGYKNTNEGEATVIVGSGNTAGTNTTRAVVIGDTNTSNSNSQVIIGKNNTGRRANQVLVGKYLSPDYAGVFLGSYAAEKPSVSGRNPDVVVAAGSASVGRNFIECYHQMVDNVGTVTPAHCKILVDPVEEDDAVRLKELTAEEQARILKDNNLQAQVDTEVSRATSRETELDNKIDAETARAEGAESQLDTKIETETSRAIGTEEALDEKIETEISRATGRENQLEAKINAEITRATERENGIEDNLETNYYIKTDVNDLIDDNRVSIEQGTLVTGNNGVGGFLVYEQQNPTADVFGGEFVPLRNHRVDYTLVSQPIEGGGSLDTIYMVIKRSDSETITENQWFKLDSIYNQILSISATTNNQNAADAKGGAVQVFYEQNSRVGYVCMDTSGQERMTVVVTCI